MSDRILGGPFLRYVASRFPGRLAINTAVLAGANALDVATIFAVAPIIDILINPGLGKASPLTQKLIGRLAGLGLPVSLESLLVMFFILFTVMNAFRILARYWLLKTQYVVLRDLYVGTFEDFFRARWYFFSSGDQGILLNTFMRELTNVGTAFVSLSLIMASAIQLVLYAAVPLYLSWQVTLVCLGSTTLIALPFIAVGKLSYRLGKINTETGNKIGAVVQENLGLAKIVLGFGNPEKGSAALAAAFDEHVDATVKFQTWGNSISNIYHPLGLLVLAAAMVGSQRLGLPLSEAAVFLLAMVRIIPAIGQLATQKNGLDNILPSFDQVMALRGRAQRLKQLSGPTKFEGLRHGLALESVTFGYPGREPVLTNIDIIIPKGRMVALVGESGSGKSTLIDLIMGFHEPLSGRVLCDGAPLAELDINSFRRKIGYVPQDAVLFSGSIRDNLLWAKGDATEEDIRRACRQAYAAEFIEASPKGYDTEIGDRGVRLSGGQLQRVALARAILRKPEILILDEATSALDTHSERLIQQALEELAKETTVVVVAHRFSTIVKADLIYVLEKGRVIEEGSYAVLMGRDSRFRGMARLQALDRTAS